MPLNSWIKAVELFRNSCWPPLDWLVKCNKSDPIIEIFQGRQVEIVDEWFFEAAWAGEYESGDLDITDIIAGSVRESGAIQ